MKSFRHRLPPLRTLLVFEAAARHLNFTVAARELHVTQAAVSKQVGNLEQYLDTALFVRHGRRLALTDEGRFLQQKINASLEFLCRAVGTLAATPPRAGWTFAANRATSQYWLGPVVQRFAQAHPDADADLRVVTSDITEELLDEQVDLALLYDVPRHRGWRLTPLFAEELFPVAAPEYLDRHGRGLPGAGALRAHDLLDFERVEPNWVDWRQWFTGLGIAADWLVPKAWYTNYTALIEAAELGRGVALATARQIDSRIRAGRLERLGTLSLKTGRHYWLGLNAARPLPAAAVAFHDWLLAQS